MSRILTTLQTESIDNYKYERLTSPFIFESDELKALGGVWRVTVPAGFVFDLESVPIVRGSNKRAGTAHDYLCRIDSIPIVTKAQAAAVYLEMMAYTYGIVDRSSWQHFKDFTLRWAKYGVVYVAPGYFHKHKVMASSEEISGFAGDPFVTVEKLDAIIEKVDEVVAAIKEVPIGQAPALAVKSEQVSDALKGAKEEVIKKAG